MLGRVLFVSVKNRSELFLWNLFNMFVNHIELDPMKIFFERSFGLMKIWALGKIKNENLVKIL